MSEKKVHPIICFGEVLWDILPTGAEPGGAPMNVAYHAHKLGKNPCLITRIGVDDEGGKLLKVFRDFGVCTDYFQLDHEHITGKVFAEPNEHNEVVYEIVKPVAWDFIEYLDEYTELVSSSDYFVFGSLASRSKVTRDTLFSLLEVANTKVLDINLRAPHYDKQLVTALLEKADFLKMNLAELELITGWFSKYNNLQDRMNNIREKFNIQNLVVTKGGDGAVLQLEDQIVNYPGVKVEVVDTVGSGDAFLAGLLSKLIDKVPAEKALQFAGSLGAFVATKRGACPEYTLEAVENIQELSKT